MAPSLMTMGIASRFLTMTGPKSDTARWDGPPASSPHRTNGDSHCGASADVGSLAGREGTPVPQEAEPLAVLTLP